MMVRHLLSHNEHHKTCNRWYSGMVALIYSNVGMATDYIYVHSKNMLG